MKVTEEKQLYGLDGLTIDMAPQWDHSRRIIVRRHRKTVFSCVATPRPRSSWLITECLPQRRDAELTSLLFAVSDWLAVEHAAAQVLTITPASWDEHLAAGGAALLHRNVPMWMPLDDDLLLMHSRRLPAGYDSIPLNVSDDTAPRLAQLSTDGDRDGDLRVWQETLAGDFGPVIPDASRQIVAGSRLCAAIAVTGYHGVPLVSHFVTAASERGNGLGRALLVESMKGLSRSGYADCRLHVVEDNWTAHRLYRSIGFIQLGPTLRVGQLAPRKAP
jgi:GNAT superfamily N-acetyltransferase